jgi:hypothetical protein
MQKQHTATAGLLSASMWGYHGCVCCMLALVDRQYHALVVDIQQHPLLIKALLLSGLGHLQVNMCHNKGRQGLPELVACDLRA